MDHPEQMRSRYRGCLLGGAMGDALGAPVEFLTGAAIRDLTGPAGVRSFLPVSPGSSRVGLVTDDTQMTIFTADGLLRAWLAVQLDGALQSSARFIVNLNDAYQRWYRTQLVPIPESNWPTKCGLDLQRAMAIDPPRSRRHLPLGAGDSTIRRGRSAHVRRSAAD